MGFQFTVWLVHHVFWRGNYHQQSRKRQHFASKIVKLMKIVKELTVKILNSLHFYITYLFNFGETQFVQHSWMTQSWEVLLCINTFLMRTTTILSQVTDTLNFSEIVFLLCLSIRVHCHKTFKFLWMGHVPLRVTFYLILFKFLIIVIFPWKGCRTNVLCSLSCCLNSWLIVVPSITGPTLVNSAL